MYAIYCYKEKFTHTSSGWYNRYQLPMNMWKSGFMSEAIYLPLEKIKVYSVSIKKLDCHMFISFIFRYM